MIVLDIQPSVDHPYNNDSIIGYGNNKLDDNSSQNEQRTTKDVFKLHLLLMVGFTNHYGFTFSLKNMETQKLNVLDVLKVNEGQVVEPSTTTTIASFLNGNTKYIGGNEYSNQDIYDAYERY